MTHILQNVVFPLDRDPDLLPLYADPETWSSIDEEPVRVSSRAHIGNILGRTSVRVVAGRRVSLGTYFNAFPASYWQHWTPLKEVRLTVRVEGDATVLVYRSTSKGIRQRLAIREVSGTSESHFDLQLNQYSDGGWIWFDVIADAKPAVLLGGEWTTEEEPARTGKASIGTTTYNKPDYCVATLTALADAPDALALVDRIFLIDQGTQKVKDQAGYAEVAERLGETLQIIEQPNLGGSGGFARSMYETLQREESDFVQLLDDDVEIEPESLRRSIVFGRYATTPTIVGGHMFDLLDRPKLHAWAEVVDRKPFMWRTLYQEVMPHDFGAQNLRQSPELHMRMDADYNGWWMTLIPKDVIREIGLSLPAFIKWDDAEYSIRAGAAGYSTVSLPGVALWHVSWVGKDDSIDWQAYFHARNRIVAALLHSPEPHGGHLIRHSRRADLKHLMMMQYYPAELRARALRDVLSGPEHMWGNLATAMPAARALQSEFAETRVIKDRDTVLKSRFGRRVYTVERLVEKPENPTGLALRIFTARTLLNHWFHKPKAANVTQPEVEIGKEDAAWWRVPEFDSALVSAADGSGKVIYTRDRAKFRQMLPESIRLHAELRRNWPELSRQYRAALSELTSTERWHETFTKGQ